MDTINKIRMLDSVGELPYRPTLHTQSPPLIIEFPYTDIPLSTATMRILFLKLSLDLPPPRASCTSKSKYGP